MRHAWIVLLLALPAAAHPLPTKRFDRTVEVRLTAAGVSVKYTVELNSWSMVLDGVAAPSAKEAAALAAAKPSERAGEKLYAKKRGAIIADGMVATVNGLPLVFRTEAAPEIHPDRDHLDFRFRYFATWPPELDRGKPIHFDFNDTNYEGVSGNLSLTLKTDSTLDVQDFVDPGGLRGRSPFDLKPGEELKLRKAAAVFELPTKEVAAPVATPVTEPTVVTVAKPGLLEDVWQRGLTALFDSDAGIGVLLLAALLFGMAHAFTPGHGKTLVAAYLVGERGTIKHALVLGFTTTLAHTGSVIGMAIVLATMYRNGVPETAQGWLQFAGGMLILLVGLWLLLQRLRGRADHVHLFNDVPRKNFGWGRVLLLGLGGGLIPCWDAVMLLLVAIAAGRLKFAIPMLVAFSVGLAIVLVALGIGVVLAHRAGLSRFGERSWFKALPIASALLLVMMGLWLAREGVQMLSSRS